MEQLLEDIGNCIICKDYLPQSPNPIMTASSLSRIAIVGQAPGSVVDKTGIPWNDKSGERLRSWMGIDQSLFYDTERIALVPMGFCYPGKGKSGDLPPRKECAPQWHQLIFNMMKNLKLILLIGKYSQDYYLKDLAKSSLTDTVHSYAEYLPNYFVLPHPSPRNNIWLRKNSWFEEDVLPDLKKQIQKIV